MRPTSEFWAAIGVGAVLSGIGVLGGRPLLLLGGASIAAWLLVAAARASSTFAETDDTFSVGAATGTKEVVAGGTLTLSVVASAAQPVDHLVEVDLGFPAGIDTADLTLRLSPGEERVRDVLSPGFPIAGRFTFPDVTVRYESRDGLFRQSTSRDTGVTVTVDPRGPKNLHLGAGGERTQLFGGREGLEYADRGDDVASTREYEPGDAFRRIDWKATARLDTPIVREFESDRELRIRLLVDARSRLRAGERGRTKLDYLREVGLQTVTAAARNDNPLALTVVDDEGIRTIIDPARTDDHFRRIRDTLLGLETTPIESTAPGTRVDSGDPLSAHRNAGLLAARADSQFAATLRPYFERTGSHVDRLMDDQLFEAVQRHVTMGEPGGITVILTDDEGRGRLTDTVRLATRRGGHVTVGLAPTTLFGDREESQERAFEQYADFERYRRSLDRLPRVTALEIAPRSRLQAVLSARKESVAQD